MRPQWRPYSSTNCGAQRRVTTALVFTAGSHPRRSGPCSPGAPAGLRPSSPANACGTATARRRARRRRKSLIDTEALIARWHSVNQLGCTITRACVTAEASCAAPARSRRATRFASWIQSHVAGTSMKSLGARRLFPDSAQLPRHFTTDHGLIARACRVRALHPLRRRRPRAHAPIPPQPVCPTSNLFHRQLFGFAAAEDAGFAHGLASDVGSGTSFSPFHFSLRGGCVKEQTKPGQPPGSPPVVAAPQGQPPLALGLRGVVGNLAPGCDADVLVLGPSPRRCSRVVRRRRDPSKNC